MEHWCESGEEKLLQLQINNIALWDKVFEITTIDPNALLFYSRREWTCILIYLSITSNSVKEIISDHRPIKNLSARWFQKTLLLDFLFAILFHSYSTSATVYFKHCKFFSFSIFWDIFFLSHHISVLCKVESKKIESFSQHLVIKNLDIKKI